MGVHVQPADQPVKYKYPCCNKEGNQIRVEAECTDKLEVTQCKDCGRKQRELTADPGVFQAMVAAGQIPGTGVYQ